MADRDALPLLKGTLDLLVLKTLSWGPMHGYGIASWLESRSEGALGVDDSALYQALHRLEERGLLAAEWGVSENNRRARYYRLTKRGEAGLRSEARTWERYARTVHEILVVSSRAG
ncbi:MAG TPA: PadR family transcriptional regulator [Longimicrobiales bacterium]|nr:PadR family transcriptional regulator [Longimicrobiales bacterium]